MKNRKPDEYGFTEKLGRPLPTGYNICCSMFTHLSIFVLLTACGTADGIRLSVRHINIVVHPRVRETRC